MGGLPFLDRSARHYSCLHLAPPLPPESARHRNHGPAYQPRGQTPGQYLHSTKRVLQHNYHLIKLQDEIMAVEHLTQLSK